MNDDPRMPYQPPRQEPPVREPTSIDVLPSEDKLDATAPARPQRSKLKRIVAIIIAVLLLVVMGLAGATYAWYQGQLAPVDPSSQEKTVVTVRQGMGPSDIAATLDEAGVIRNQTAFGWYVRLNGVSGSLQSGSYRIGKNEDVPAIVGHLTSGDTDTFSITFLPGNTIAKHRQTLIDAGYDAADVDAAFEREYDLPLFAGKPRSADLEGYVYGETYQFSTSATPEQILERTFEQFQTVIDENDLVERYRSSGFSLYEGITFASIIQREERDPGNQRRVSQVFNLRLERDMPLGSDPTYQYAADKLGVARDPSLRSPYNTRIVGGLPPGPIASPGETALTAVIDPTPGSFLYFLSGDDDQLYFGRTLEEHERNIREHCQQKCQIL